VLVDVKRPERSAGASGLWRARTATFGGANVIEGAIPINSTPIVEWLAGGTDVAIVFGLLGKMLGTKEGAILSVNAVPGAHAGSDAPICQPMQDGSSVC
jgi:hypothetical protein